MADTAARANASTLDKKGMQQQVDMHSAAEHEQAQQQLPAMTALRVPCRAELQRPGFAPTLLA